MIEEFGFSYEWKFEFHRVHGFVTRTLCWKTLRRLTGNFILLCDRNFYVRTFKSQTVQEYLIRALYWEEVKGVGSSVIRWSHK